MTAQKRSERLLEVPISITAVSGDQLARQNVTSAADLERVVPGFTYQPSSYGVPVFSIRGVGFYETSLAVSPAVTVYLDQIPLPFLAMTPGVSFDLERVEALKGPQGTLFGQNSTGGAINYIAAKPTPDFAAGASIGYGRFDQFDVEGYVSGPLSSNLTARLALRSEQRDGWQRSVSRPNDRLGKRDFLNGRFLLDWAPSDRVKLELSVNGWRDKSDTQAGQYRQFDETVKGVRARPDARNFLVNGNYPFAPPDIRSADWDAGKSLRRDDEFYQVALRGDADISDTTTLTSISAYSHFKTIAPVDADGTPLNDLQTTRVGSLESIYQELRVAGDAGRVKWVVGGNLQIDNTDDNQVTDSVGSNQSFGPIRFAGFINTNHQKVDTWAAFGGLDYRLTDTVTLQGSLRYTAQDRDFRGCLRDVGGPLAAGLAAFSASQTGVPTTIATGACVSLDANFRPIAIQQAKLDEDNLSWRASLNWKPANDLLLYANVTRGYKAGSFGTLPAIRIAQLTPVKQESLLAYETGLKVSLFDRRAQLSAAAFYYDYTDKQILATLDTGFPFGFLPGLITIPKSDVKGAEVELHAAPVAGLSLTFGATYVDSRVNGPFNAADPYGLIADIGGQRFPNTPKWQAIGDAEYRVPLGGSLEIFAGGSVKYRSSSYAAFGGRPLFEIEDYALLDLRAGIETADGRWRAQLWGRNVTNKRYLVHAIHSVDTVAQITGMPATYGLTLSARY